MGDEAWQSKRRVDMVGLPQVAPLPEPVSKRVLEEANRVIHGQRAEDYGSAEESFTRIAQYWSTHLGIEITGYDVAMMMVLMKVARAKTDRKLDTVVDIAGYAALAPRLNKTQ